MKYKDMEEPLMHTTTYMKKAVCRDYILSNFEYMPFWKKVTTIERVKRTVAAWGKGVQG